MNTQTFAARLSTLSPPRREGLTAIFRKAQERILPTATATCSGWLNPEDSIGRYIGKAKWDHIWEAIGPARDAFNRVAPKIKDYLESAVEPISSRVTWSMYMIGKSASLASPSIIFCCDVLEHRREVRNTIKGSGILNDYPGIKTGHLPRPPDFDQLVPLGEGGQLPYNRGDIMALTSPTNSACGSQLFVFANGSNPVPQAPIATIGGVIRLGENFYYTTAAHALEGTPDPTAADGAMVADEDFDTDDDALSLDSDEDVSSAPTSSLSALNPGRWQSSDRVGNDAEDNRLMRDDILRQWSLKRLQASEEPLSSVVHAGELSLNPTGRPFILSTEGGNAWCGLDYALIEISSRHHIMENVIKVGPNDETTVKVHAVAKTDLREAEIIAVTPRGITKGWISGTPAYSSAPGKQTYVKMLKVSLQEPLDKSDCGTWVVDAANGDLFGHVVLGSPSRGSALLTPFADIFHDIVSRVGKSPTFPSARDTFSSRSADKRNCSIEGDEGLSHIIRNTISLMGESSEPLSTRDGIDSKRTPTTTMVSESHKEGTPDLGTVTERSEEPTKQAISGSESRTKELNVAKNDSAVQPEPSLDHAQQPMASNPDSAADDWFGDISEKFGRLMVQKRMKPSRQRDRIQDIPEAGVQSKSSLPKNSTTQQSMTLPHIGQPGPPLGPTDSRFKDVFFTLSKIPIKWENNELLDLALKEIDLQSIYSDAEEENEYFVSLARSQGVGTKPEWGYQDCVIRALSRYFRWTFFTRVTNPPCEACGSKLPTLPRGNTQPSREERAGNAEAVELYQCAEKHCQAYTRFPRYLDVGTLLITRRGRAGESSNCFGMICRALGSRVRWVWNAEDNIWTEVYSEHQQRWVHVDTCAAGWDNPLLYTEVMGQKLSYCIAFSSDGATDVTWRYVRALRHALPRTRCSEAELLSIIHDIKSMRRIDMSEEDLLRLDREDAAEAQELKSYAVPADTPRPARSWHKAEARLTKRKSGIITPRKDSRESLPS